MVRAPPPLPFSFPALVSIVSSASASQTCFSLPFSHFLLSRVCRMAATLHSKINRKRLDKLDIIKIW
jgi:hypothetical protein